ncbi:MAG TPA: hypothetical protein VKT82_30175 [Ktedonobacterales bacterium]|nr:hypothetical protein [Ktedonobacterales bacterium]
MGKSALRDTTEQGMHRADFNNASRVRPTRGAPPSLPRWVKVLAIIALVLFVVFLLLRFTLIPYIHHVSGQTGLGDQTPLTSVIVSGGQLV